MAKQIKSYETLAEYYSEVEAYIPDPPQFKAGDVAQIKSHGQEMMERYFADGTRVKVIARKYHGGHDIWCYTVTNGQTEVKDLFGVFLESVEYD